MASAGLESELFRLEAVVSVVAAVALGAVTLGILLHLRLRRCRGVHGDAVWESG